MKCGLTFRSGRTRPADGQSNNSETLSRIQSLADYTIDTLESSFQKLQDLMPRECVCVALVAIFALAASRSAQAQVTVDVTKVNCDQFVHHKISEPRLIAAWLSGYYNAKRNNRVIDLQDLEEKMSKVTNYCSDEKNFKMPVMKAVEQILGERK